MPGRLSRECWITLLIQLGHVTCFLSSDQLQPPVSTARARSLNIRQFRPDLAVMSKSGIIQSFIL